jgi:DNA topoisomerase-3
VQTPTLAMVVDRFKEIKNFKPQPYWELQTVYRDTLFSYEEGRFLKRKMVKFSPIKSKKVNSKLFLSKKNGNEFAPKLFDLTGLQVYCNTKFGFTADETLKIVQTLYEQKWSPTQSRYHILPNDIYPKVLGFEKLDELCRVDATAFKKKIKNRPRFSTIKVTDHHAIIPTGIQQFAIQSAASI